MAKRVSKKEPAAEPGADDLTVLHPERQVTIAGRELTIREYGFVEGLRLLPVAEPLIQDLQRWFESGELPEAVQIQALLGRHADAVVQLMVAATDVELEWITGLNQADGTALMYWWWMVNGPFYVRSALDRVKAARELAALRAGLTSMPPSSPPATETPPPSAE